MAERPIRFEIERPVDFRLTDVRGAPEYHGRTVNISSGGILFRTDQTVGVGRKIELLVRMSDPALPGPNVTLHLQGRVIRSGPGWAAARVQKRAIFPTAPPGTPPDTRNSHGKTAPLEA
jgi:hypothetical protein